MNPKWNISRPDYYGFWYVEGIVRYEIENTLMEYRYKTKNKSKKDAERIVSKEILTQVYRDFPCLWSKYRKVKEEKGFD